MKALKPEHGIQIPQNAYDDANATLEEDGAKRMVNRHGSRRKKDSKC